MNERTIDLTPMQTYEAGSLFLAIMASDRNYRWDEVELDQRALIYLSGQQTLEKEPAFASETAFKIGYLIADDGDREQRRNRILDRVRERFELPLIANHFVKHSKGGQINQAMLRGNGQVSLNKVIEHHFKDPAVNIENFTQRKWRPALHVLHLHCALAHYLTIAKEDVRRKFGPGDLMYSRETLLPIVRLSHLWAKDLAASQINISADEMIHLKMIS